MPPYYLDIETTGLDPKNSEIITIQYQKIAFDTGKPLGPLIILTSWEYDEETIVKEFASIIMNPNVWNFVPVGNNLPFEFKFLVEKINKYLNAGINLEYFISRPHIDIKPIMILANHGRFKGYHLVLNKSGNGSMVPQWYFNNQHDKIINYIKDEAAAFTEFISKIHHLMFNNNRKVDDSV